MIPDSYAVLQHDETIFLAIIAAFLYLCRPEVKPYFNKYICKGLGMNRKAILATVLFGLLSVAGAAQAVEGQIVICHSFDQDVGAQIKPKLLSAVVWKRSSGMPSHQLDCSVSQNPPIWLDCVGSAGRTLILNQDLTGRYFGRNETHELQCGYSGHSAD